VTVTGGADRGAGLVDRWMSLEHRVPPYAELIDNRDLDFAGVLAGLHELVGKQVYVTVAGPNGEHVAPLAISGTLHRVFEIARTPDAPLVAEVGEIALMLGERRVTSGCRELYRRTADGATWILVFIRYRNGATVEVEEVIDIAEI
jgi:hypothetical protein